MCGRYKVTPGEFSDLRLRFNLDEIPLFKPRYNIAPTQQAPVIANLDGANRVELFQWGLVPWWAKDISIGNRMINARAESLAEKSSFKSPAQKPPLSGVSGWRSTNGVKKARAKCQCCSSSRAASRSCFAGLWDAWKKPDGQTLRTYTIVTTEPNEMLAPVHNRMPVMLNDSNALDWLKGDEIEHALKLAETFSR